MKAILTFNLPKEDVEMMTAINGFRYRSILGDVDTYMRDKLKYGHKYKKIDEALEDVRQYLWDCVNEHNVEVW